MTSIAVPLVQVERGTTATYLSSGGGNFDALVRLQTIRAKTDRLLAVVDKWPPDGLNVNGTKLPDRAVRSASS